MKTNLFILILMMSFTLTMTNCSSPRGQHAKGNIFESEWGLVSVKAKSADSFLMAHSGTMATLNVLPNGTIKGTTGCNSFEGQVAIDGYSLKFGNLICTQLTCKDTTLATAFYDMLDSTDNYTVEHGHLLLKKGGKTLAKFMSLNIRSITH